jgi:hypothetical protein
MGLTNKKEDMLREMPSIRSTISKSKDGRYLIHRTIITHIKPVAYYEAVLAGRKSDEDEEVIV